MTELITLMLLVPELVGPRQDGDSAIPDVARVVNLAVFHLHLCILQPQSDVSMLHVQRALVNRTSPESRGRRSLSGTVFL